MAHLYRMVTDEHICPYGLRSKDLLERKGYEVYDHHLTTRAETDDFKRVQGVETTPQTFIDDVRVGGLDDLERYFGIERPDEDAPTYQPVIATFGVSALMALAASWPMAQDLVSWRTLELFIAFAMCALATQKLQDLRSFQNRFITYDLLGMRKVRYALVYPFLELGAGVAMIAGVGIWIAAPVAAFIGLVGAVSVIKAVYVEGRELECACVGGESHVPLGAVSLTENLMMVAMAVWMPARMLMG